MNLSGREAIKKDTEFFVDSNPLNDDDRNEFGCFGNNTGFCYFYGTEAQCEEKAKELSNIKNIKSEVYI